MHHENNTISIQPSDLLTLIPHTPSPLQAINHNPISPIPPLTPPPKSSASNPTHAPRPQPHAPQPLQPLPKRLVPSQHPLPTASNHCNPRGSASPSTASFANPGDKSGPENDPQRGKQIRIVETAKQTPSAELWSL